MRDRAPAVLGILDVRDDLVRMICSRVEHRDTGGREELERKQDSGQRARASPPPHQGGDLRGTAGGSNHQ